MGVTVRGAIAVALRSVYLSLLTNHFLQTLVTQLFHHYYYAASVDANARDRPVWTRTNWLGVSVLKCPFDLWTYQEIIRESALDIILETGTAAGGSALFLASICQLVGRGRVITIDTQHKGDLPKNDRITYIKGSSVDQRVIEQVAASIEPGDRVMVILDSNHSIDHVKRELELYSQFVTENSYIIVEDTNLNGHPVMRAHGPGPMEAVREFLHTNNDFVIDRNREKFYLTFNPCGYLRRVTKLGPPLSGARDYDQLVRHDCT